MRALLFSFLIASSSAYAQDIDVGLGGESGWTAGVGVLSFESFKNTNSELSETGIWGTNYITVQVQGMVNLFGLNFAPRLLYTPLGKTAPDEGSTSRVLYTSMPYVSKFGGGAFDWRAGLGFMYRTISGSGGTTVLNNGSSTSTFALPDRTEASMNFTLEAGAFYTSGRTSYGFEVIGASLISDRRAVNLLFSMNVKM